MACRQCTLDLAAFQWQQAKGATHRGWTIYYSGGSWQAIKGDQRLDGVTFADLIGQIDSREEPSV